MVPILTNIEPERFYRPDKIAPGLYFISPYQMQEGVQETLLIYDNDQVSESLYTLITVELMSSRILCILASELQGLEPSTLHKFATTMENPIYAFIKVSR